MVSPITGDALVVVSVVGGSDVVSPIVGDAVAVVVSVF